MFAQMEALVVGEGISLADLKGTLLAFVREMFSPRSRVRFRPSFFPYTEPSAEIDISCWQCDGAGCPMCKKTGWIEIGGCGMVHPAVFEAVGYDAERYTGFAWGIGIERDRDPAPPGAATSGCSSRTTCGSWNSFRTDVRRVLCDLLISWVRDFVDVTAPAEEIAEKLALRGFEVASIETAGRRRRRHRLRGDRQSARLPERDRLRARNRARSTTCPFVRRRPKPARACRIAPLPIGQSDRLKVTLEDAELCPRYAAAVADVTPATSPAWMTDRLQAAGVRPISPFVDITNYVLMELGHPMHAFDLAKLAGSELRIRRAASRRVDRRRSTASTRSSSRRCWSSPTRRRPQAMAGVMGGADSEVSGRTRTVAFESAYFKPASVRRTSKRLGLKTEASSRFERGADINAPVARPAAGGRADAADRRRPADRAPIVDRYPQPRGPKAAAAAARAARAAARPAVPDAEVERILRRLGLTVASTATAGTVVRRRSASISCAKSI